MGNKYPRIVRKFRIKRVITGPSELKAVRSEAWVGQILGQTYKLCLCRRFDTRGEREFVNGVGTMRRSDGLFASTTKQFSNSQQTLTGYPTHLIRFWQHLPGEGARSHGLRAQSHQIGPTADAGPKSRLLPVLLATWLHIGGSHESLLRFN